MHPLSLNSRKLTPLLLWTKNMIFQGHILANNTNPSSLEEIRIINIYLLLRAIATKNLLFTKIIQS